MDYTVHRVSKSRTRLRDLKKTKNKKQKNCVLVTVYALSQAFQVALVVKNPPANAGDARDMGFDSWVGKIPWRREWQPTPVFLPGESHGQRWATVH